MSDSNGNASHSGEVLTCRGIGWVKYSMVKGQHDQKELPAFRCIGVRDNQKFSGGSSGARASLMQGGETREDTWALYCTGTLAMMSYSWASSADLGEQLSARPRSLVRCAGLSVRLDVAELQGATATEEPTRTNDPSLGAAEQEQIKASSASSARGGRSGSTSSSDRRMSLEREEALETLLSELAKSALRGVAAVAGRAGAMATHLTASREPSSQTLVGDLADAATRIGAQSQKIAGRSMETVGRLVALPVRMLNAIGSPPQAAGGP